MLKAAQDVIDKYRDYWPLTLRQIHYRLLVLDFFRNARKRTRYVNKEACYKDLSDLLTRARLLDLIPWESMHDPTRQPTRWRAWPHVGNFLREKMNSFLTGYRRDLLQSQPRYIELVVEKMTVLDIAERAAQDYMVPVGIGRGYTSTSNLWETAERYHASGKDGMTLLIVSDFDPEGENICETWAACLRDEHGIDDLTPVKVGLNPEHVTRFGLMPLPVKKSSSRCKGFEAAHGGSVYELEALEPDQLQSLIRHGVSSVLNADAFRHEQEREREDARRLMACRRAVLDLIKGADLEV